jgi:predicted nucleic acid-binding protein
MIVVSDASPLNVLVRIGFIDALPELFQAVFIPPAVVAELTHAGTPESVRRWLASNPSWLTIKAPTRIDATLEFDDAGEREAISLALEIKADLLLADDRKARKAALARGLAVTRAVGVLEAASAKALLDLFEAFQRLRATDFIVAENILAEALRRDAARKGSRGGDG